MSEQPVPDNTLSDGLSAGRGGAAGAPGPEPAFGPPAAPGEVGTLGPYRVSALLGRGGMGAVYRAVDTRLDRPLALKVMLPWFAADPVARGRFLREARAAARVVHDHVVTVYEADERDGLPYLAMQLLRGYPLDVYLRKKGDPPARRVLRIAREAAAGLAAAHAAGLVHRDVKPGNLWLEAPGGRVKVLDFGLARPAAAGAELTTTGAVLGTPAFMSPEQARGEKVDHRTDLFSLGVVLYRLTTGRLPFDGPNVMAVLMALGTEEPRPVRHLNPSVPGPLADLIHHLLAKNPADRPGSAEEVVGRVRAVAGGAGEPSTASRPPVVPAPVRGTTSPGADTSVPAAAETDPAPSLRPAAPAPADAPRGRTWRVAAGVATLIAAAAGVVILVLGTGGTRTEVPEGTGAAKAGGGEGPARAGAEPPVVSADPEADRRAAEWVLSAGGQVRVGDRDVKTPAELPADRFVLSAVRLSGTGVTDDALARLRGLRGLTELHLSSTRVTGAGLAHLRDSRGLRRLTLARARVADAGLADLGAFPGLTHLDLSATGVTDAALPHLRGLAGLTHLDLSVTGVTDAGLAGLKPLTGLTSLWLYGTGVGGPGLAHLKDLTRLAELQLGATGVTDAGLAHLTALAGLRSLDLSDTKVTDAGLPHLTGCRGLRALALDWTRVTDAGLARLRGLPALARLGVRDTKVTAGGVRAFRSVAPWCAVGHGATAGPDR